MERQRYDLFIWAGRQLPLFLSIHIPVKETVQFNIIGKN